MRLYPLAACACATALSAFAQSEPTAIIDTTAGRIVCTLFTHTRPDTTARFNALAGVAGVRIVPSSPGISFDVPTVKGKQAAASTIPAETAPPLPFDRPGLIAMIAAKTQAGPSRFLIADHANTELDGHAIVFGQCDAASVRLVAQLRRTLQSTDNHPAAPVAILHIAIVPFGKPLPPPPPQLLAEAILPPQSPAPLPPPSGPEPTGPVAVIRTSAGTLSCRLFSKESPIATSTFLALADGSKAWTDPRTHAIQRGHRFYDGQAIDRVLPDFYIQFGDITGDISGNTDIGFRFQNENTPGLTFDRPGRLAFGNGGPDTNSSELFFALNPMHALDGDYTILGQCDEPSLRVLATIASLPRDASNRPLTPIVLGRIAIHP